MFKFVDGRVFIDIGEGCGNACTYCYVKDKDKPQIVYAEDRIKAELKIITADSRFIPGITIVALCPHTEPFKSIASANCILIIVKTIAPMGNIIQIATKEIVPAFFLEESKKFVSPNQLILFISCSCFTEASQFEPFAVDYGSRLKNIEICHQYGFRSVLYLKPFLLSDVDIIILEKELRRYHPDSVCLGITYQMNKQGEYHHPTNIEITSNGINERMYYCAERIQLNVPVFYTSTCAIAWINGVINNVSIPKKLCVNCNPECCKEKWNV